MPRTRLIVLQTLIAVLPLLLVAPDSALAQPNPARKPSRMILRIELGTHTAPIRRISVDDASRYLVTASEDKTARVWDLASGKLLRVLRPSIGVDNEGALFAVSISPDGQIIAVAGATGSERNYSIYLYERSSGRLVRRLAGLPGPISNLQFSFVDTCHSGNSLGLAGRRGSLDINVVINELSSTQNGVVVFSGSTGSESAYEKAEWNNGAFTKALVEGLNGSAAIGNTGRITYNMLNVYVSERVKELTKGQQHPTMISPQTVPDFPVAVKK